MLVCFDTHAIIWGIKEECTPGQEEMIQRAKQLIRMCEEQGHRIIIPSIVVSELLIGIPLGKHADFVNQINESYIVAPYDTPASVQCARMWLEKRALVNSLRESGVAKRELKADFMIAATAIARKCDCIYTEDRELERFAESYIEVNRISDVLLPATQDGLFASGDLPSAPLSD